MALTTEQRQQLDGTSVGVDALTDWARQREWQEFPAGMLAGMAYAVNHRAV